jgi:phage RecT family recombinase
MSNVKPETAVTTVDKQAQTFLQTFGKSLDQYAIREYNQTAFLKSAMLAIVSNADLQSCLKTDEGKLSLFSALRYAATTGLSLNPQEGKAALIAYGGKVQYQVMKGGMVDLALDSGKVEFIQADYVCANDKFTVKKTSAGDFYEFEPALQNRGDVIGFYAALTMKNRTTHVKWMTKAEVEHFRDAYSAMYRAKPDSSPWKKSFLGMGVKTAVKALLRSLSISDELDNAIGADDFFETDFGSGPVTAEAVTEKLKTPPPAPVEPEGKQGNLL